VMEGKTMKWTNLVHKLKQ